MLLVHRLLEHAVELARRIVSGRLGLIGGAHGFLRHGLGIGSILVRRGDVSLVLADLRLERIQVTGRGATGQTGKDTGNCNEGQRA